MDAGIKAAVQIERFQLKCPCMPQTCAPSLGAYNQRGIVATVRTEAPNDHRLAALPAHRAAGAAAGARRLQQRRLVHLNGAAGESSWRRATPRGFCRCSEPGMHFEMALALG